MQHVDGDLPLRLNDVQVNGDVSVFTFELPDSSGSLQYQLCRTESKTAVLKVMTLNGQNVADESPRWAPLHKE
jgi:hypothetical protein